MSGYLTELNGKYKLRATETTIEPGGFVGEHHHIGPGIRYIASGELTYVEGGRTTIYKAGDYFYESGDVTHSAYNKGSSPMVNIIFEILPADWKGGSAVLPKSK
jgi:quercetin dioxygenase-like cupin family protein